MALNAASRGDKPSSIWLSIASTTTMASSTTRPIARTKPKSDSVLIEKPSRGKIANVPIRETGTAISGMRVARQPCRKMNTTKNHQGHRLKEGLDDFLHSLGHRQGGVKRNGIIEIGGKLLLHLLHEHARLLHGHHCVRSRQLVHGQNGRVLTVETSTEVINL